MLENRLSPCQRRERLKIRSKTVDFPIAIARRVGAAATVDFLWLSNGAGIALGAAGRGFGKRALGGWRKLPLLQDLMLAVSSGRPRCRVIGWHKP